MNPTGRVGRERWAIPFADLLLLLLAVFAVLYAASSVDSVKYRATARALARAFDGSRTSSADPRPQQLSKLAADLERVLAPLSAAGLVSVRRIDLGLEVEISNDLMFDSGRAELETSARAALEALAVPLGAIDGFIRVEGHTDDVPIAVTRYPSNWELSAARASAVVLTLTERGVRPERLTVVAHAQYKPLQSNATPAGRDANRRVLLTIRPFCNTSEETCSKY